MDFFQGVYNPTNLSLNVGKIPLLSLVNFRANLIGKEQIYTKEGRRLVKLLEIEARGGFKD